MPPTPQDLSTSPEDNKDDNDEVGKGGPKIGSTSSSGRSNNVSNATADGKQLAQLEGVQEEGGWQLSNSGKAAASKPGSRGQPAGLEWKEQLAGLPQDAKQAKVRPPAAQPVSATYVWSDLVRIDMVVAPPGTALAFYGPASMRVFSMPLLKVRTGLKVLGCVLTWW